MKQIQGSFFSGYVTVLVEGTVPELFFQECINQGIPVWNIKKIEHNHCIGNVRLSHLSLLKQIKRHDHYKIKFTRRKGMPFLFKRFIKRKELLVALLLSVLLLFFLSNIIWKIEITGVPKDIEEKISKQLTSYGIHPGVWIFSIDTPGNIQKKLEDDIPELLWIGVHQKGTTFTLEGVEKLVVEKEELEGPKDLVAAKKGVIKKMYIAKGRPLVTINDYVETGDPLVSGNLTGHLEENKESEENDEQEPIYIASEGEVIANTWYEVNVTIPLETSYEALTGKQEKKYYVKLSDYQLPIWGFRTPDYQEHTIENTQHHIRFLKWDLPIYLVESTISEAEKMEKTRTLEEAIETGIKQAKNELALQLGPEAEIISENILHETTESGKVKLKLYITVEEDIVKEQPIHTKHNR